MHARRGRAMTRHSLYAVSKMANGDTGAWPTSGAFFAHALRALLDQRGEDAAKALLEVFTEAQLDAFLSGAEPKLSELVEIAHALRVPVTTFTVNEPDGLPELERVFAEILYEAADKCSLQRRAMAERFLEAALGPRAGQRTMSGHIRRRRHDD